MRNRKAGHRQRKNMRSVAFKIASSVIMASLITLPVHSQSPPEFHGFFSKFKTAVMGADAYKLQDLMARDFDFMGTTNVSPSEVFKGLGSGQWLNLQSAVQKGVFITQTYRGKPARLLRCTPEAANLHCYVVFQTDTAGHWNWKAMVMPEK
jgi:hypothetical protein